MSTFPRDLESALKETYDLVVVGGGIYGMTLTLEAARRGLRPLLVERGDFGGETSLNSLRILHGGLRYLQSLDLPRFFESVSQRSWFMRHFAPLCRTLPCLLPLYGRGLKRPSCFRIALGLNDVLSGTPLPRGRVIGREETIARFPLVDRDGLQGAGLWHDGQILSPQRLHAELLRWATACGATALNYVEAIGLDRTRSRVRGLVTDVGTFKTPVVVNAAGPWCREVAARLDRDQSKLLTPTLTFNLLLDVPPPSDAAVAVGGRRLYFVTPDRSGRTFAGTVHRIWEGLTEPTPAMIEEFVDDLNQAIPGWGITPQQVVRVASGVLPGRGPGIPDMAHRSTFFAHETKGLFSVCGIKYTTAQSFAVRTLRRIFGRMTADESTPQLAERSGLVDPHQAVNLSDSTLRRLAWEEAVCHADDFLERRIDWIPDQTTREQFRSRMDRLLREPVQSRP